MRCCGKPPTACCAQAQQALAAKEQQTSFYSHWNGGILFDGSGDTRSPTSTSPSTPHALPPNPPASVTSSHEVRSPAAQPSLQAALGSVLDSFRSPDQKRVREDQLASLSQSRIGARSPLSSQTSPGAQLGFSQHPIGAHVVHRKSSSMDNGRVPSPSLLNGLSHVTGEGSLAPGRNGKPSPRAQRAQHAAAMPSSNGPMGSLLGLNASNGPKLPGHMRAFKPSRSVQDGKIRGSRNVGTNGLSMQHLGNGNDGNQLWSHQAPNYSEMNRGNEFGYSGNQGMAQSANAFHSQLNISSIHS